MPERSLSPEIRTAHAEVLRNADRFEAAVSRLSGEVFRRSGQVRTVRSAVRNVQRARKYYKRGAQIVGIAVSVRRQIRKQREQRRPPTASERIWGVVERVRANPLPLLALAAGGIALFLFTRNRRARIRTRMAPLLLSEAPESVLIEENLTVVEPREAA